MTGKPLRRIGSAPAFLRCVPVLLFVAALGEAFVAWGQWQAPPMKTEIWMSGDDVALFRRSRANCSPANADNQQFARSMLQAAEKHLSNGDSDTANWLIEWAQQVTSNPLDTKKRSGTGGDAAEFDSGVAVASVPVRSLLSSERNSLPAIADDTRLPSLAFVPATLSSENSWEAALPIRPVTTPGDNHSDARDEQPGTVDDPSSTKISSTEGTGPTDTSGHCQAEEESQADDFEPSAANVEVQAASGPCIGDRAADRVAEPPAPERTFSIDDAARLVAAAARTQSAADRGVPIYRAPPVPSAGRPITIAVISFAAGIVSCAAVCIALCFLPFRAGPVRRPDPALATATAVGATQTPDRNERDNGNRIIEEFFDRNVELYRELAQTG